MTDLLESLWLLLADLLVPTKALRLVRPPAWPFTASPLVSW